MVGSSSPNNLALNNGGRDHGAVSPVEGSNPGAPNLSSTNMSNMSTSSIFDSPGDDSRPSRRQFSNRSKSYTETKYRQDLNSGTLKWLLFGY